MWELFCGAMVIVSIYAWASVIEFGVVRFVLRRLR